MRKRFVDGPAGPVSTALLFGVPGAIFWWLFHSLGPRLLGSGVSWWALFHVLLVLPLALMLAAPFVALALSGVLRRDWPRRLRLTTPSSSAWCWALALAGFMYGGYAGDVMAIPMTMGALWCERQRAPAAPRWSGRGVLLAVAAYVLMRRALAVLQPTVESIRIFDPAGFHNAFFSHFGPVDFMGIALHGHWWVVLYYAAILVVLNVGGEELWWRGYVLPRQERYFNRWTWLVHGVCWSLFHLFLQPTAWDTLRMTITGVALAFIAQRTRSTWPGVVGHVAGNLPFLLSLVRGV